jgi:quercetin 2,3-dioxygenase
MAVKIIREKDQAKGAFAGGLILENKPIGFPQDGGKQKPYSNLFYWANAWSTSGGLIGEHPHKFFEIMSFVIEGEIEHYDNKFDRWLSLSKGDAQIIRAGNGITHAEKIKKNSRMFQIWFDPNVQETMSKSATYDDYKSADMNFFEKNGIAYKNFTGNGGPIQMDSEGVEINELTISKGEHRVTLSVDKTHSLYLIKGSLEIDKELLAENDFLIIEDESSINLNVNSEALVFMISSPKKLSHKSYSELVRF